jgi:hypothetical protein
MGAPALLCYVPRMRTLRKVEYYQMRARTFHMTTGAAYY